MKVTYEFFNQDRCLEKWMEDWVLGVIMCNQIRQVCCSVLLEE